MRARRLRHPDQRAAGAQKQHFVHGARVTSRAQPAHHAKLVLLAHHVVHCLPKATDRSPPSPTAPSLTRGEIDPGFFATKQLMMDRSAAANSSLTRPRPPAATTPPAAADAGKGCRQSARNFSIYLNSLNRSRKYTVENTEIWNMVGTD